MRRQEFVVTGDRAHALRLCPWALHIVPAHNGFFVFESYADFKRWQAAHPELLN